MPIAILRAVSGSIEACELTHLARQSIDVALARQQHQAYAQALETLGCQVQILPEEPDLPDAVFVEDAAVVLDEVAILTRPGAASRRPEVPGVARALQPYRKLLPIDAPGTVDGGDVLCIGKHVYVGISSRSNPTGIEQMQAFLEPYGYQVTGVAVKGCLHLKSAVTLLAEALILVNPNWVDEDNFPGVQSIQVDPNEPSAANGLWVNQGVIYPANFPRTQERVENSLRSLGKKIISVDVSEIQKAEGAVTCCSLIITT